MMASRRGQQQKKGSFFQHLNVSKYLKNYRYILSSRRSSRHSSLSLEIFQKTMMASRRRQQQKKDIFVAPQCVEVFEEK
ncbi:hypothetical protein CEXT_160891 [Caerostris extrusa]|uniref:Uncharacterized protein n=1 Tax=Caerostris extrusa TaxID=172846 RepID=A0AAV4Y5S8_CAEEX|nr:hypothetical protein CEXT_160891 [Caerostris extrusa]